MSALYFGNSLLSPMSMVGKENAAGREREKERKRKREDSYNKNQSIFFRA